MRACLAHEWTLGPMCGSLPPSGYCPSASLFDTDEIIVSGGKVNRLISGSMARRASGLPMITARLTVDRSPGRMRRTDRTNRRKDSPCVGIGVALHKGGMRAIVLRKLEGRMFRHRNYSTLITSETT